MLQEGVLAPEQVLKAPPLHSSKTLRCRSGCAVRGMTPGASEAAPADDDVSVEASTIDEEEEAEEEEEEEPVGDEPPLDE